MDENGKTEIPAEAAAAAPVPAPEAPPAGGEAEGGDLRQQVIETLCTVFDPEIPVNIYELGLVYDVAADQGGDIVITMTLTTPNCPVAGSMPGEVETRVAALPGVRHVEVNLVWDPPWTPERMSEAARLELGMI
jgi:FeS assembly SUF system protein